jgi:hypothetical protein
MPRLASDIRTTLVGLEKKGGPSESLIEALRRRSRAPSTPEPPPPSCVPCSCSATTTSTTRSSSRRTRRSRGRPRAPRRKAPLGPYAAEARWMHAVSLRIQGRWDDALVVLDTSKEVVPPIYRRTALRHACTDPGGPRRGRGRGAGPQLRPFWREEGLVATTAGSAELEAAELTGDQAARLAGLRADHRDPHQHLAPAVPGPRPAGRDHAGRLRPGRCHRSATERVATRRWCGLVDDAHAVLERRNEKSGTSWGPRAAPGRRGWRPSC